jgi:hypothetical protein
MLAVASSMTNTYSDHDASVASDQQELRASHLVPLQNSARHANKLLFTLSELKGSHNQTSCSLCYFRLAALTRSSRRPRCEWRKIDQYKSSSRMYPDATDLTGLSKFLNTFLFRSSSSLDDESAAIPTSSAFNKCTLLNAS